MDLEKFRLNFSRCANYDVDLFSNIFILKISNVLTNGAEEMPLKRHPKGEVRCGKGLSGVRERPS